MAWPVRRRIVGEDTQRWYESNGIIRRLSKGKENAHIQRSLKSALSNLERQLIIGKKYIELPNRKRSLAVFHRIHDRVKPMKFDEAVKTLIERIGPVRLHTLRFFVSRPVEELAETLRDLENAGKIARVVALQPDLLITTQAMKMRKSCSHRWLKIGK